jgi:hypothetical protein
VLSYRRTPRRQGLKAVGYGGRDAAAMRHGGRCIFLEIFGLSIYFSKIKEKYKKIQAMTTTLSS